MTVDELANRIAALRARVDKDMREAQAKDEKARNHLSALHELGIEVEPWYRIHGAKVDFYNHIRTTVEREAIKMVVDYFEVPEPRKTEIVLQEKVSEPNLRPGYDAPARTK